MLKKNKGHDTCKLFSALQKNPENSQGAPFAIKQRKAIPHAFLLDSIAPLWPPARSMFGCLAVYVQDKTVVILRVRAFQKLRFRPSTKPVGSE